MIIDGIIDHGEQHAFGIANSTNNLMMKQIYMMTTDSGIPAASPPIQVVPAGG